MLLIEFIHQYYGELRGCQTKFLLDNPEILAPELSRWIKGGWCIDMATGDIYRPSNKKIKLDVVKTGSAWKEN